MKNLLLTTLLSLVSLLSLQAQITTGLQAEYLLDANVNDSQNTNNATIQGTTLYGEDRFGVNARCYAFDGNTRLALPQNLTNIPEISISMWFLTGEAGGLISHNSMTSTSYHAPVLYIGGNGKLMGKLWDGNTGAVSQSNKIVTDSLWHHVVITGSPSGQKVYLDNQLVGSTNGSIISGSFNDAYIGYTENASTWPSLFTSYFSGRIDDVRIYNIAISDTVVNELYDTPTWTPPTYAWDLDTLYVDPNATGNNDGSSWANAYTDAREAFINTTENCEIWIAQGTYIRNATDRNSVFGWSVDSIMVYGGFTGGETSRDQRDWNANPTIFSGDLGIPGDNSDNAYTVFTGPFGQHNYSLIDGIKITGGNADVDSYPNWNTVGGGMTIDTDVDFIEIKNVEFYDNYAKQGGALSAYGISGDSIYIKLENVVAHNNTGRSSAFGHIRASNLAPIQFEMVNCLIYENNALASLPNQTQDFGTVLFLGANANINNTIFASITNCTFANNTFETAHKSKGMLRVFNQTNAPSILNFTNNICYGNGIEEITSNNNANVSQPFPTVNLNNNILENGLDLTPTVENTSLTSDPLFNTDYTLQQGSPAIDAGTSSVVMLAATDLAGNARIFGPVVDLGGYEYACAAPTTLLTLNNGNLEASGASTYAWYFNGVDLILNNTSVYTPIQDGDYYVVGTSVSGCSDTSNVISYNSSNPNPNPNPGTNINQVNGFENVSIYPNPTHSILNINVKETLSRLQVKTITGQTVLDANPNAKQVDMTSLNAGIYFLEIANAEKKSVIKIIKK